MNKLNASIFHIKMPEKMKRLPISDAGFPIPWFVGRHPETGVRDFRIADQGKMYEAVKRSLCWLCGQQLGVHKAFVLGPMCAINRVISEPPSHFECAEYAVRACPFLTKPRMRRNEADLPMDKLVDAAGMGIKRNPGACALWVTRKFEVIRLETGILFQVGDPERVSWFCEGRAATRAEVDESIRTGLPLLEATARDEGSEAEAALVQQTKAVERLLPAV
jgi:hypothetical protein